MECWRNCCAGVTGASSGIGAATVKYLLKASLKVVGLNYKVDCMEELRCSFANTLRSCLHIKKCDVSDIVSVNVAFDWIEKDLSAIHILINNAGVPTRGELLTMNINDMKRTLQTNFMVLINRILGHNVFNLAPGVKPFVNIYPMCKYVTVAMTEILRQEHRENKTPLKTAQGPTQDPQEPPQDTQGGFEGLEGLEGLNGLEGLQGFEAPEGPEGIEGPDCLGGLGLRAASMPDTLLKGIIDLIERFVNSENWMRNIENLEENKLWA
uniref:Uncharacterized protein n=1 Tax=Glossina brevipalpis TaxID=37001 RepID=A0A1A9WTZ1_9MUSC